LAWANLLHPNKYKKNDNFVSIGQHPRKIGFVVKGLFLLSSFFKKHPCFFRLLAVFVCKNNKIFFCPQMIFRIMVINQFPLWKLV